MREKRTDVGSMNRDESCRRATSFGGGGGCTYCILSVGIGLSKAVTRTCATSFLTAAKNFHSFVHH